MGVWNTLDRVTGWIEGTINFFKTKKRDDTVKKIRKGVSSHSDDAVARILRDIENKRSKRASRS